MGKIAEKVQPNPQHKAAYDELYEMFKKLYLSTRPVVHPVSDLQK